MSETRTVFFPDPVIPNAACAVVEALHRYDEKCFRVFGGRVNHAGRTGAELMALIRSIETLEAALKADAVDPHVADTGNPSTRVKK